MNVLEQSPNFRSLSIRDLLDARDQYHYHLMNKANVVATAIGLYLIRDHDHVDVPRTFSNSRVQEMSWPCVLVFVREWFNPREFAAGQRAKPTDMVPKTLYMPDGRAVPVCTVLVEEPVAHDPAAVNPLPNSGLGGGLPLFTHVQGSDRQASTGCLVTDGHLTYALTARHACGPAGTPVYGRLRGRTEPIGYSSALQLTRRPFNEVYPDFPGKKTYVALDVGLVEVDDINQWTSNIYGLPATGALADIFEQNLTLQLIDAPVVAHGAVSGLLRGKIKALFYRYRSVGGYDYVGDLLIAPIPESQSPVHGDSGTVWHLDATDHRDDPLQTPIAQLDLRPLAVLCGGQTFEVENKAINFTVATTLSNVFKLLDVELVSGHNQGVSGYWGRMGHYSIAAFATAMVEDADLRALLQANLANLSFDIDALETTSSKDLLAGLDFVPLADVADEVWKKFKTNPGGRDVQSAGNGRTTGPEHPNHYADIDFPYQQNQSLRELCLSAPEEYFTPAAFIDYYEWLSEHEPKLGGSKTNRFKQGLLPFRIWQIFNEMSAFAEAGDTTQFVAAAGIVAHYLGDACQPLHGSVFADGDPRRMKTIVHPKTQEEEEVPYAGGVHSVYETAMIDRHKKELFADIQARIENHTHATVLIESGQEAGLAAIELMQKTAETIPAMALCDAYEKLGGTSRVAVQDGLFEEFGAQTADVMVLGIKALARFWDSAWKKGNPQQHTTGEIDRADLKACYENSDFLQSFTLQEIRSVLT